MRDTAYAKINLALHVRERRDDGYHELETVFAFVDAGDVLTARNIDHDGDKVCNDAANLDNTATTPLRITGEFADGLDAASDNLVTQALETLEHRNKLQITLEKNLPIAAGLGGGSADAGAVFRIVDQLGGLPDDWRNRAAKLGADVPACVDSRACIGRGTGTELESITSDLTGMPVLLVNPRVALSTGAVFKCWDGEDRGPLPTGKVSDIAQRGRNDLEPPAISLCPEIATVLEALNGTNPWLARMSGSGATCFALYDNIENRDNAAAHIQRAYPSWWYMPGALR